MYRDLVEKIATYFTKDRYKEEYDQAREEYFKKTGKVFEDDPLYESRITALIEWYLFDRELRKAGVPPIRLYYTLYREQTSQEAMEILEALQKTIHSLYEIIGRTPELVRVRDLFSGAIKSVEATPNIALVEKGDILDARFIPLPSCSVLSDSCFIHPREVRRYVLSEVEKVKEMDYYSQKKLLFSLAHMKLKMERYKHISAEEIYSNQSPIPRGE